MEKLLDLQRQLTSPDGSLCLAFTRLEPVSIRIEEQEEAVQVPPQYIRDSLATGIGYRDFMDVCSSDGFFHIRPELVQASEILDTPGSSDGDFGQYDLMVPWHSYIMCSQCPRQPSGRLCQESGLGGIDGQEKGKDAVLRVPSAIVFLILWKWLYTNDPDLLTSDLKAGIKSYLREPIVSPALSAVSSPESLYSNKTEHSNLETLRRLHCFFHDFYNCVKSFGSMHPVLLDTTNDLLAFCIKNCLSFVQASEPDWSLLTPPPSYS